jgi:putative hemolysin
MKNMASEGNKKAALTLKLSDNYDKLLSTLLIGNNIVNISLSSIATVWFIALLKNNDTGSAVSTAAVTVVVLIFGEISPKSLAKDHAEGFAMAVAPLIRFLTIILTPINWIFYLWKLLLTKVFKSQNVDTVTEGEVLTLVDEAHEDGSIDEYNKELIENIFEFDDLTAGEIATHRTELKMLSNEDSIEDWDEIINNSRFTRYPIYENNIDNIIGILDARSYLSLDDSKTKESVLASVVKSAYFVPENVKADVLFKNMKENKEFLAVVLDEYGGVQGVVTLTDLVECLVGEFNELDEENEAEEEIVMLREDSWQISGSALISDVEEELDLSLKNVESDTINGFVLGIYGSIPEDGTSFDVETDTLSIHVEDIKDHKIEKAVITLKSPDEETSSSTVE